MPGARQGVLAVVVEMPAERLFQLIVQSRPTTQGPLLLGQAQQFPREFVMQAVALAEGFQFAHLRFAQLSSNGRPG